MSNPIVDPQERMAYIAKSIGKAKAVINKFEAPAQQSYAPAPAPRQKMRIQERAFTPVNDDVDDLDAGYDQPLAELPYNQQPQPVVAVNKNINSSKMPKEILESFQKNPVKVNTSNPLGISALAQLVEGVKQYTPETPTQGPRRVTTAVDTQVPPVTTAYVQANTAQPLSEDYIKFLIQETVKTTVKTVLEELSKVTSINEDIQINIGGKTFGGTLKTLKEVKS